MKPIYQIRSPFGLFSCGGLKPRFSKTGKLWRGMGPVRLHVRQTYSQHRENYYGRAPDYTGLVVMNMITGDAVMTVAQLVEEINNAHS